eukprot:204199-Prorocentrum_minimum.AAC.3
MSANLKVCIRRQRPRSTRNVHKLDAFTGANRASTMRTYKDNFPPVVAYFDEPLSSSCSSCCFCWTPFRDDIVPGSPYFCRTLKHTMPQQSYICRKP